MSNAALYLKPSVKTKLLHKSFVKVAVSSVLLVFTLALTLLSAVGGTTRTAQADNFDPVRWVMCLWGQNTFPEVVYQTANSNDLQFALRSKSSVSTGADDIDGIFNKVLMFTGQDFVTTNENILGYREPNSPNAKKPKPTFNSGVKVNPYDRFGVAGLKFSGYTGEWKYLQVNACSPDQSSDPQTGKYYTERLVPESTWADIGNSQDVRTRQFNGNLFPSITMAFVNNMSNYIFDITKLIVVFTIALINFAFSDIVSLLGLTKTISGDGTANSGIFGRLFQGVFLALIVPAFAFTGIYIFWTAVIKREYRRSMTSLIRSLLMLLVAFIVAAKPLLFIALPNNIAVGIQAIIVQTMNTSLAGGDGLCATDAGTKTTKLSDGTSSTTDDQGIIAQASINMRSSIGCSLWQQFLLKPWAQGQWGVDWNQTWAKGKKASWAPSGAQELNNNAQNQAMVGNAAVPMGGKSFIYNWAIFQISTQTSVHSPYGINGQPSKYTAGLSNDWWRIVDVNSNYSEKDITINVPGPNKGDPVAKETITVPANDPRAIKAGVDKNTVQVLPTWNIWVGNSIFGRLMTSLSSVLVALIGVAAPLFFAGLSAIYSFGIALLMAFAPVMLLFGCWADRGWNVFLSWAQLVINTTLKRIVTGILLVLSIMFSATAIKIMQTDGWWQGVVLMMLLSLILITSRKKIIDSVASVRFATEEFRSTHKFTSIAQQGGRMMTTGVAGGVAAKRAGGTFTSGVKSGVGNDLKNMSYQSRGLSNIRQIYEQRNTAANDDISTKWCSSCGVRLDSYGVVYTNQSGSFLCQDCGEASTDPDLKEMYIKSYAEKQSIASSKVDPIKTTVNKQALRASTKIVEDTSRTITDRQAEMHNIARTINSDIEKVNAEQLHSIRQVYPEPPDEIKGYLDIESINEAWSQNQFDYIRKMYSAAWARWFIETVGSEFTGTVDELVDEIYLASTQ